MSKIRKPISVEDADQVKNLCENLIAVIANVQDKNKSLTPIARESIDDILDLIIDIKVDCVDYINREGQ